MLLYFYSFIKNNYLFFLLFLTSSFSHLSTKWARVWVCWRFVWEHHRGQTAWRSAVKTLIWGHQISVQTSKICHRTFVTFDSETVVRVHRHQCRFEYLTVESMALFGFGVQFSSKLPQWLMNKHLSLNNSSESFRLYCCIQTDNYFQYCGIVNLQSSTTVSDAIKSVGLWGLKPCHFPILKIKQIPLSNIN